MAEVTKSSRPLSSTAPVEAHSEVCLEVGHGASRSTTYAVSEAGFLIGTVPGCDIRIGGSTSPAAMAGYPSITVPAGFVAGLPVGISFFGRAYSEPVLLKLAFAFEQATKFRAPPGFLPSLPLPKRHAI